MSEIFIEKLGDFLASSRLGQLFLDLDSIEMHEEDGVTHAFVKLANPGDEERPNIFIFAQSESRFSFQIPRLAFSDGAQMVMRVAVANHENKIPKVCWNPESKEIYVSWAIALDENPIDPIGFEKILAHMLYVFFGERGIYLRLKLKKMAEKGEIASQLVDQMMNAAYGPVEETVLPLVVEIIRE